MNTLVEQQRRLLGAIVRHAEVGALLAEAEDGPPRIGIYRHAYTARLTDALRENFGVLPHVMGDEAFEALALGYIAAHPSRHPSIRWYGVSLPAFMHEHEALVPHPALADLARMEWAMRSAFDAAQETLLTTAQLTARRPEDWPGLVIRLVPSAHLLDLAWAVEPLWRAMQGFDPAVDAEPDLPEPEPHRHTLLIWRQGLENRWRSLDAREAALLTAADRGLNFAALCEIASRHAGQEHAAATVVHMLRRWIGDGLVS